MRCESNSQLLDLNFAKPKQHLFSVKPRDGGNVLVNGPHYRKSRGARLTSESSYCSFCVGRACTVVLSHLLEVRGGGTESNILSCFVALIFMQGKPGEGQKYLQNTYYVSGIMLGNLHYLM